MILTTTEGLGAELGDLLRQHLRIPQNVVKFSVHFNPPNITVECAYHPEGPEPDPDATVVDLNDPVARHNARKL